MGMIYFFSKFGVPNLFHMVPLCLHKVFNDCLLCSQCVPQVPNLFSKASYFIPYSLPKAFLL
jgi:hypothetical protein